MEENISVKSIKALVESQSSDKKNSPLQQRLAEEKIKDGKAVRTARYIFQGCLLILLIFEIFFVAYLMISQGVKVLYFTKRPFQLNEWGFGLFINVALIQTCILVRPIAINLFPHHRP